ncbi:MAG: hypothetical protein CL946_06430 [Ectothiorhodospiraceae bacterium]|nr:hypothetical protein [Ectothiorhodospiraceae bacterium]
MLRYLGHDNVQVLDGGWSAYLEAGGTVTKVIPETSPTTFIPDVQHSMRVDMKAVRELTDRSGLFDCRSAERYRGENETIDPKAGHIPGAKTLPWRENLTDQNAFLPVESLRQRYGTLPPQPVMYCGSGVTACVNILAMEHAGMHGARLYPGSWSDWISYDENEIE